MQEGKKTTAVVAAAPQKSLQVVKKDGYWGLVAARYTLVKRILLIALILFIVFFMIFFSRAFTYDSLFSFFKDLQSVAAFVPSDYQTITATYHEGSEAVLSYRGGVAFVNQKGIEIYSPNGKRLLDVEESFAAPRAAASRKYLLAYDKGGNTFLVTSAYAKLYEGKTDFPIYGVALSDAGHFAIITGSDTALSTVLVYDANFNLIQRFSRASATLDVALSANGKRIALLGINAENGQVYTKIDLFRLGDASPESSAVLSGEVPLALSFTDNKHLAVLTDQALHFASSDLEWDASYDIGDRAVIDFAVNADGVALVLEENAQRAEQKVIAFDEDGKCFFEKTLTGNIKAVDLKEKRVFVLADDRVACYDTKEESEIIYTLTEPARDLFVIGSGGVRVIYQAKAEYIDF